MGEKKPAFEPRYEPVRDDVNGKMFSPGAVRSCPEPNVIKRFGTGGVANVSVYTCRKCRYHQDMKWFGGTKCGYMG
jgi:hypothetical protein